ncbi:hypothetical protein [Bradyrhizobium prioriisuperbiae]|uniref:phosphatase domain-containing putative toxin n=1 Tax=Bradyrhizobium prioriisuperbiae TaxID=2854389 RepID=UPI0028E547E8|nr:hypothetical protein [Bradyrhizobium prioritasuperba]
MSRLHWIDAPITGRLATMARPRADDWLEDEIAGWKASGLSTVVSLLEAAEVAELGLRREAELCKANDLAFVSFPIPDRGIPDSHADASVISQSIAVAITGGRSVAIHCRAGIGRSSLIASCALICAGIAADHALGLVKAARGVDVPDTEEQRDWIVSFGEVYLSGIQARAFRPR